MAKRSENKTEILQVRITPEERIALERASKITGSSIPEIFRQQIPSPAMIDALSAHLKLQYPGESGVQPYLLNQMQDVYTNLLERLMTTHRENSIQLQVILTTTAGIGPPIQVGQFLRLATGGEAICRLFKTWASARQEVKGYSFQEIVLIINNESQKHNFAVGPGETAESVRRRAQDMIDIIDLKNVDTDGLM